MSAPAVRPEKSLHRVCAIARGDGWSVVIVATLGGLVSLWQGGGFETVAATLAVLAGCAELQGRRRLLGGDLAGVGWLIGAQVFLLAVICVYAWFRWRYFDAETMWSQLPDLARTEIDRQLLAAGLDPPLDRPLLLQMMNLLACAMLACVSLLYQGGLALYYAVQRERIRPALPAPPPLSAEP